MCREVLKEDVAVCICKMQLMVEGKEETTIVVIWVTDCIDRCHSGFVSRHMVRHTERYDGGLLPRRTRVDGSRVPSAVILTAMVTRFVSFVDF